LPPQTKRIIPIPKHSSTSLKERLP
jgi:hypothetical protein